MAARRLFPSGRLIALAALAGVVAGAAAVYFSGGLHGNNAAPQRAQPIASADPAADPAADTACRAKEALARALGDAATGHVAALLPAEPPQSVASLAFDAPDGKPMTLSDRAGKALLVNLWATWCAPCRAEMPALDTLQKEMGSDRFEVVAVNVDTGTDEKPKKFLGEIGISSLGFYRDETLGLFNELKRRGLALGLPVTLLVDGEGCLLAHMNGPAEWASDDARRVIRAAVGS